MEFANQKSANNVVPIFTLKHLCFEVFEGATTLTFLTKSGNDIATAPTRPTKEAIQMGEELATEEATDKKPDQAVRAKSKNKVANMERAAASKRRTRE